MGAFFFSPGRFDSVKVSEVFAKKGFDKPMALEINAGQVLLYKKQLLNESNLKRFDRDLIFSVGTLFYKGKKFTESLDIIFKDYINGTLETTSLIGSFFLFIQHDGQSYFLTDRAGIQNVFFNREMGIISSSFLAVLVALGEIIGKQSVNKLAIHEVLTTGNLIGPDTLIESIERFEPAVHAGLPGMKRILYKEDIQSKEKISNNYSKEIDNQINSLCAYFDRSCAIFNHYGVISGLTGGFDSRLLYLVLKRFTGNYQIYSTFREKPGPEYRCAEKFALAAGEKLFSPPHTPPEKMEQEELLNKIRDNFYFNDGLIRTHQLWLEEIKGRDYLKKLYGSYRIGFSGVGGEQYRNNEYLVRGRYLFDSWVRNEFVKRVSGNSFLEKKNKSAFLFRLRMKISNLLGMKENAKYITKYEIKRYYNEIWNPANRTIRNNIENQLVFFLSPFTDYQVSHSAYDAIPYLGYGPEFEMKMIGRLAPELAHCKTEYGFSVAEKPGLELRVLPYVKSILGLSFFNSLYYFIKKKRTPYFELLLKYHPEIQDLIEKTEMMKLSINYKKIKGNDFLSPLLIEVGFFLTEMEKYIDYE